MWPSDAWRGRERSRSFGIPRFCCSPWEGWAQNGAGGSPTAQGTPRDPFTLSWESWLQISGALSSLSPPQDAEREAGQAVPGGVQQ